MTSHPKQKKIPKKNGRPSKRTDEVVETVLRSIADEGLSLRKACEPVGITAGLFVQWVAKDPELSKRYAYATNCRNELLADEILDIADCTSEDDIFDSNGNRLANAEWINRSRLRIDSRKWLLSKLMPKKYGDKLDVTSTAQISHNISADIKISSDPVQAAKDYEELMNSIK